MGLVGLLVRMVLPFLVVPVHQLVQLGLLDQSALDSLDGQASLCHQDHLLILADLVLLE